MCFSRPSWVNDSTSPTYFVSVPGLRGLARVWLGKRWYSRPYLIITPFCQGKRTVREIGAKRQRQRKRQREKRAVVNQHEKGKRDGGDSTWVATGGGDHWTRTVVEDRGVTLMSWGGRDGPLCDWRSVVKQTWTHESWFMNRIKLEVSEKIL